MVLRKQPKPDKPTGPSGPTAPTGTTTVAGPTGPAAVRPTVPAYIPAPLRRDPITSATPIRLVGDATEDVARGVLEHAKSPLLDDWDAVWEAMQGYSIALLAFAAKESSYGTNPAGRFNAWGIMDSAGFVNFSRWANGAMAARQRLEDYGFKSGVYGPPEISVRDFITVYQGGPLCRSSGMTNCANGETRQSIELSVQQFVERANRIIKANGLSPSAPSGPTGTTGPSGPSPSPTGLLTAWDVAGSEKLLWLPDGVGFSVALTPKGPNRSGRTMRWTGVTQHTTNNVNRGTDALMHSRWQDSGTPGNPGIGVHFYVDDKRVIQKIPVNEQGVHSGDWRNQAHTAIELCVNADRNAALAERNSQALCAGLLGMLSTTAKESLYPHTNGGHCPRLSVSWDTWEREVDRRLAAMRPGPAKG
jgi:hypothetical protein